MTAASTGSMSAGNYDGWPELLDWLGPPALYPAAADLDPALPRGSPPPPRQIDIRELYVRTEPEQRRTLDVLCIVRVEREPLAPDGPARHELVFFGPDFIANHVSPTASGIRALDLRVASPGEDVCRVSLVLASARRSLRTRDILLSLENLGRCLDYRGDPDGSSAIAAIMVRRLEALVAVPGVNVPLVGEVDLNEPGNAGDGEHLLLGRGGPSLLDVGLDVRVGGFAAVRLDRQERLEPAGPGPVSPTAAGSWHQGDFVLIRAGDAPARPVAARSLAELRQQQALIEAGVGEVAGDDNRDAETWSARASRARAILSAERITRLAVGGDPAAAGEAFVSAFRQPGVGDELPEQLAARIRTVKEYWALDAFLQPRLAAEAAVWQGGLGLPSVAPSPAKAAQNALLSAVSSLLGFARVPDKGSLIPIVTPLVLEVGEGLVPFVDSRQDGGVFLSQMIEELRNRIEADTGVKIPGLRARGLGAGEPADRFAVQVEEVTRREGRLPLDSAIGVRLWPGGPPPPGTTVTTVHPGTGQTGIWLVYPLAPSVIADTAEPRPQEPWSPQRPLSLAQLLIHHIETVARDELVRYLGIQETANVLGQWAERYDARLMTEALGDAPAVRTSWLLQDLVAERVPIVDGQAILEAVRDAGGPQRPTRDLRRAVRSRLRHRLPGPRTGDLLVPLPDHLEAALTLRAGGSMKVMDNTGLLTWLRKVAVERGPVFSVVTADHEARELVAVRVRGELPLVTTFCRHELEEP